MPAMTAWQPPPIYLTPHDPTVGAGLLAKVVWQATQLDRVHIRYLGNGHLGFRPDGGSPGVLPGYPRIQACVRPAWFNGAPKIKSQIRIKSGSLRIVVSVG
ncbi:hypothetical protein RS3R2_27000 [Pseudomonas lactis]|nr:hypothetical protein RS3R2_27000 [Pseudomonas lactis]